MRTAAPAGPPQAEHEDELLFCAFNPSGEPGVTDMPEGDWHQVGIELGSAGPAPNGRIHLGPWQPALALRAKHQKNGRSGWPISS